MSSLPAMSLYKEDGSEVKVNFQKNNSRVKSAGSSKPTKSRPRPKLVASEREYSKETHSEAYKLYESNDYLAERLQDANFHEACLYCGVLVDSLYGKPFTHFKRLPNRVRVLDDFEAKLREEEYNKVRLDNLRQVVEREQECIEYQRNRREKEERYFAGLKETYRLQKQREAKRKARSMRNRENLARAVMQEDQRLREKRDKGARSAQHYKETLARINAEKQEMINKLKMKGKARDNHIRKQVEAAKRAREARAAKTTAKFEEKYAQIERMLAMQRESSQGSRSQAMQLKAEREEMLRRRTQEKHERLLKEMAAREEQVKAVQLRKKEIIAQEKIVRQIKNQSRRLKAEQTRRATLYARKRYVDHMESVDARIKAVEKMREAVNLERHTSQREELIERHRWKDSLSLERMITPGPGEYQLPDSSTLIGGGAWGKFKSKTDIDIAIERARDLPGPGNYQVPDTLNKNGGSWSFYSPKSEIETLQARAADMPGPGEYELKGIAASSSNGVQFSDANPMSSLDRYIYENKDTPGPGSYSKGLPEEKSSFKKLDKQFGPKAKLMLMAAKFKHKLKNKINQQKGRSKSGNLESQSSDENSSETP